MMRIVYFDAPDGSEIELVKTDVMQSESVRDLLYWREVLLDLCADLGAAAGANKECGVEDRALAHKYGQHKIALHWVRKRLNDLGEDPDASTKEARQAKHITDLIRQNQMLQARVAELEMMTRQAA